MQDLNQMCHNQIWKILHNLTSLQIIHALYQNCHQTLPTKESDQAKSSFKSINYVIGTHLHIHDFNIHDSASLIVDCKSWTLGWDSLVHPSMWSKIQLFSHRGHNCPQNTWKRQISLQGGGAREHLWRHSKAIGVTMPYAVTSWRYILNNKNSIKVRLFIENKGVGEKLSIVTLRKGQGNPILVSIICDINNSATLVLDCKSWTLRWNSLVPSGV